MRRPAPSQSHALLSVGLGCDADCLFCLRNAFRAKHPPSATTVDFEQLSKFLEIAKGLGVVKMSVGGDEPTLLDRAVLVRIIRSCRDQGFSSVALTTNGISMQDLSLARDLMEAGATEFWIPIYAHEARLHDSITQTQGSFSATLKALQFLSRHADRVKVIAHAIVLRQNEEHIESLRALLGRLGLDLHIRQLIEYFPHVNYAPLWPARGAVSDNSARIPAPALDDPGLKYNLLSCEIQWHDPRQEPVLLRDMLAGLGVSGELLAGILRDCNDKPLLTRPTEFAARIEELKNLPDGRARSSFLEILSVADAQGMLKKAMGRYSEGNIEEGRRLFSEVGRLKQNDPKANRAKEIARRMLELLDARRAKKAQPPLGPMSGVE